MGSKRKNQRKSKRNKFNKNKRNSSIPKLESSNSVLSADCSPCTSDLDRFANKDKESASTGINQELRNFNSLVAKTKNFLFPGYSAASRSLSVTSTKERESFFTQIEGASGSLIAEQKYEFYYGKTNLTELVADLSTDEDVSTDDELCCIDSWSEGNTDCSDSASVYTRNELETSNDGIGSLSENTTDLFESKAIYTRDELQSSNDGIIDPFSRNTTDSSESKVIYSRDELESLKDGIVGSLSQGSSNSSESTVIFNRDELESSNNVIIDSLVQGSSESKIFNKTRDLKSPVCRTNNSSPSFSVDIIDPLQRRVLQRNGKLTCLPISSDSGSTILIAEPADIIECSFSVKISSSDSASLKEEPSNVSSIIPSYYKETLILLKTRKKDLEEIFNQEMVSDRDMGYCLERLAKHITNPENLNFTESKRNACIQNIYKKKLDEASEFTEEILSQFFNILNIFEENYEIQLRELEEIFGKFGTFESDNEIGFVDENWKCFVENTINNFRRMDNLKTQRKTDIHGKMRSCLMKLLTVLNFLKP